MMMEAIDVERESVLRETLEMLLTARRTRVPLADLPAALQPHSQSEAYWLQDRLAEVFGPVGGWKIGRPAPGADPIFAPMPQAWIAASGSVLNGYRYRGLEAEIAFLVGSDLPPREQPYTSDEVLAAMASCHPAIEVLESAFVDPATVTKLAASGDLQVHGGFLYGPAYAGWRSLSFPEESVMLVVDGLVRAETTGGNASEALLELLHWLANEAAARTGGLRAGQWITTGSWTGNVVAATCTRVMATFAAVGTVELCFGR